jgi:hypothetical protein
MKKSKKQDALEDSGIRKVWNTGAQRDMQYGKGAPHLVPGWVVLMISRIWEDGALKYDARNWEKGMPLSQYIDSMERHLAKLKCGRRNEPHASQLAWNAIAYIFTAALIKMGLRPTELNDMPDQISDDPMKIAEPLSDYEYKNLQTFLGWDYEGYKKSKKAKSKKRRSKR